MSGNSNQNQIVYTCCFQSVDAVVESDGAYKFHTNFAASRLRPSKVMLGSFEFPMTQYPIEERRNRVYMNESLLICEPLAFVCHERWAVDGDVATRAWSVVFPASYNPVVGVDVTGDAQTVTFAKRHGLFANGFCVPDNFTLHAAGARVPLEGSRIVDDFTVQIDSKEDCGHGVLYFREPCDVVEMAALLTQRVRKHNPAMRVLVETVTCRLECRIDTYPAPRCESYAVSVSGSLLDFIGLSSFERRFQREPENLLPRSNFGSSEEPLVRDDRPPLVLFSDVVSAWSFIEITPGWYQTSHAAPVARRSRSRTSSTFSGTGCTSFPTNPPTRSPNTSSSCKSTAQSEGSPSCTASTRRSRSARW